MQTSLDRALPFYIGIFIISGIMLSSLLYTVNVPKEQGDRGVWVGHTREAIGTLNMLESSLYKAILAYDKQPQSTDIREAQQGLSNSFEVAGTLLADNPTQLDNLQQLQQMLPEALDHPAAFLEKLEQMRTEEKLLLEARQQLWRTALTHTQTMIALGQLLLYVMAVVAYRFFYRELARRRRAIAASKQETDRLHRIVSLQHAVTTEDLELAAMMTQVVDQTRQLIHADGCVIERIDGDDMVYDVASGAGSPFIGLRIPLKGSFSGRSISERAILRCDDAETDPRVDQAACRRVGVRSMVVVPLLRKGSAFGVLKIFSSQQAAFSDSDFNALEIIAALVSARITEATNFSAIRAANRELTSEKAELLFTNAQLGEMAVTDGLTGLRNHRYFIDKLSEECLRAARHNHPFSLVLLDVDHFKKFNDSFGHVAGDQVLKKVGKILKHVGRETDIIARHGGEEFSAILPDTDAEGAHTIAERLRSAIANEAWDMRDITISVGVATFTPEIADSKTLLEAADKALYTAKDAGRNCVRHYKAAPIPEPAE